MQVLLPLYFIFCESSSVIILNMMRALSSISSKPTAGAASRQTLPQKLEEKLKQFDEAGKGKGFEHLERQANLVQEMAAEVLKSQGSFGKDKKYKGPAATMLLDTARELKNLGLAGTDGSKGEAFVKQVRGFVTQYPVKK